MKDETPLCLLVADADGRLERPLSGVGTLAPPSDGMQP